MLAQGGAHEEFTGGRFNIAAIGPYFAPVRRWRD